jgi:biotin synthase
MRVAPLPVLLRTPRMQLARAARLGRPKPVPTRMSTVAAAQTVSPSPLTASQQLPQASASPEHDGERQQKAAQILREAVAATAPRHNWTRDEISAIFYQPLMELAYQAVSLRLGATQRIVRMADR